MNLDIKLSTGTKGELLSMNAHLNFNAYHLNDREQKITISIKKSGTTNKSSQEEPIFDLILDMLIDSGKDIFQNQNKRHFQNLVFAKILKRFNQGGISNIQAAFAFDYVYQTYKENNYFSEKDPQPYLNDEARRFYTDYKLPFLLFIIHKLSQSLNMRITELIPPIAGYYLGLSVLPEEVKTFSVYIPKVLIEQIKKYQTCTHSEPLVYITNADTGDVIQPDRIYELN